MQDAWNGSTYRGSDGAFFIVSLLLSDVFTGLRMLELMLLHLNERVDSKFKVFMKIWFLTVRENGTVSIVFYVKQREFFLFFVVKFRICSAARLQIASCSAPMNGFIYCMHETFLWFILFWSPSFMKLH